MRCIILILMATLCLALVSSHPLPEDGLQSEALDRLVMAEADNEAALRSKRTIGILRQLFPDISQRIEAKVNAIVAEVIRALGPIVLRNILGGNRNSNGNNGGGTSIMGKSPFEDEDEENDVINTTIPNNFNTSKISISLPTFPPDEEGETTIPNATIITENDSVDATMATTTISSSNNEVTTML